MTEKHILPSQLFGRVAAPPAKSDAHRGLICACLSRGKATLHPIALSRDIQATIACAEALGAIITYDLTKKTININAENFGLPQKGNNEKITLDCGESGSTLRFFIPIAAALGLNVVFTGEGRLPKRPIGVYEDILPPQGIACKTKGGLPFEISGTLQSGVFTLPGNVSSQFVSGLLMALPMLPQSSEVVLTSPLESEGYVQMTISTLKRFGVKVTKTATGYSIPGGQKYNPCNYEVEGDWSQAAFWLVAGAISGSVTVTGLSKNSLQPDKKIAEILKTYGAAIEFDGDEVTAELSFLQAPDDCKIDVCQIPDLVPILAVLASLSEGKTKITNAQRLRIKESDRLTATARALRALGGLVQENPDGLEISGTEMLKPGKAEGKNDHRIVMATAIAALLCDGKTTVTDSESIEKSYPTFWDEYTRLGGRLEEY
ncbi:MAG: 3-phosphoshikimate 1-carboxyvinyltransferase [Oscillospiraceae bacterium]|jgi:3-phosphoshikimate 1-carboxyvinyltransferase|nr:3-phosphoshikimate 1-carboxyvinyltransferase [Oscillospiraceae bacterium]